MLQNSKSSLFYFAVSKSFPFFAVLDNDGLKLIADLFVCFYFNEQRQAWHLRVCLNPLVIQMRSYLLIVLFMGHESWAQLEIGPDVVFRCENRIPWITPHFTVSVLVVQFQF